MIKVVYRNHLGEELRLSDGDYKMLRSTTLFDYEWSYEKRNDYEYKVFDFSKSMVTTDLSLKIQASSRPLYEKLCSQLLELFEVDVDAVEPGKIIINDDYYLNCYIIKKSVTNWYPGANSILNQYRVLSEDGMWYKDVCKVFGDGSEYESIESIDYPYDYPYDYAPPTGVSRFHSDSFLPFDFELTFYGPVTNPTVTIAGHLYQVYTEVPEGQKLVVDSLKKTIIRISRYEEVNEFNNRNKESNIFERITTVDGYSYVSYTPNTKIQLKAYTKRSEPKLDEGVYPIETQAQTITRLSTELKEANQQIADILGYKRKIIKALIDKEVDIEYTASWEDIITGIYSIKGIEYDDVLRFSNFGKFRNTIYSTDTVFVTEKGE